MGAVTHVRTIECRSDVASVWRLLVDTERLNRAVGLGRLALQEIDDDSAARYLVKTRSGALPLEYEERPFEWVEFKRFSVERVVRRGPVKVLRNEFRLEPTDDRGTRVDIRITVEPRFAVLSPVVWLQVRAFVERVTRTIVEADQAIAAGKGGAFGRVDPVLHGDVFQRTSQAFLDGARDETEAAQRITDLVAQAPDADVQRIRPYEWADRWGLDRRAVLTSCLRAVVSGLLELQWDLVCPSCHTAAKQIRSLGDLGESGACQFCDIQFGLELDRAVEATFRPASAVRAVDAGPYCIGGPYRTPHVVVQQILAPNAEARLLAPTLPGPYRMFVRGGAAARIVVEANAAGSATVEVTASAIAPREITVAPEAEVVVVHRHDRERHAKIERAQWTDTAATAHDLTTMPAFRRQFARELLRPGLTLSVARSVLLFTDLTGSTAMYTMLGDARAFKVVQDHFDLLRCIIEESRGVIVKTIGDAIMASFLDDAAAVRAAIRMHRALVAFRREHPEWTDAFLKVGLHAGACYVVTANGALDYFGQTVNIAARLQACSQAGELVMADELAVEAEARGWLDGARIVQRFEAQLRGLGDPVRVARVLVDPAGAERTSFRPLTTTSG
jgi:class 3 adenylate cyclase